jgi:hypothetical protein
MQKKILSYFATLCFAVSTVNTNAQALLVSQFDFNNNLNDQFSISTCSPSNLIGSSYSNGGFNWVSDSSTNAGGGLVISIPDTSFTQNNYSIALTLQFSKVAGYRKIIDFSNLTSDQGFYYNFYHRLYSIGISGSSLILPDTSYTLFMTRNGSNDSINTYIYNGVSATLESKGKDISSNFVAPLVGVNRVLNFFQDDVNTIGEYTPRGKVSQIRIWNGIVSLQQIASLSKGVFSNTGITMFPNPAENQVELQFQNAQRAWLNVYNVFGEKVETHWLNNEQRFKLEVKAWEKGIYFIECNSVYSKFVKQ